MQEAKPEHPDSEKLQDILFSQPRQPQRPPGFAPDEAPVPARRKNRLQRELVVRPPGYLCMSLLSAISNLHLELPRMELDRQTTSERRQNPVWCGCPGTARTWLGLCADLQRMKQ